MIFPALRGYNLTLPFLKSWFMGMNNHFKVQGDKKLFSNHWVRQFRKEVQEKTGETFETGPEVKSVDVIIMDSEPKMLAYLILLKEGGFKTSFTVYKEVCLKFQQEEELLVPNDLIMSLTETAASGCETQPSTSKQTKLDVRQRLKLDQCNRKRKKNHTRSQTEKKSEPSVNKTKRVKIDHRLNTEPKSSTSILLSEADKNLTEVEVNNGVSVSTTTKDSSFFPPSGDIETIDTESWCGLNPEDFNTLDFDTFSIDDFPSSSEQEIDINGDVSNKFYSNLSDLQAVNDFFPNTFVFPINDVVTGVKPLHVTVGTQTDHPERKEIQLFVEDSQKNSSLSTEVIGNAMMEVKESNNIPEYDGNNPLNLSITCKDYVCMWDMFPLGQRQLVQRTSVFIPLCK